MSPLPFYLIAVLATLLLSAVIVYAFIRYRFRGDRTVAIIVSYYLMFIAIILLTLTLIRPAAVASGNPFS